MYGKSHKVTFQSDKGQLDHFLQLSRSLVARRLGFLELFTLANEHNVPRMLLQEAGVVLQRQVWLRSLLCEGQAGETAAAHPGVQETL